MENQTLILLPNVFPYGKGDAFLESEIKFLTKDFQRIIVFPSIYEEGVRSMPSSIELNNALLNTNEYKVSNSEVLQYFVTKGWFWKDLLRVVDFTSFKNSFYRFFNFCKLAYKKFRALENFIETEKINKSGLIIYSYWFVSHAMAIALLRKKYPQIKGVTRTHEYDLYEKGTYRLPFRKFIADKLNSIVPISEDGQNYLTSRYGIKGEKIELFNLGVENEFVAKKEFHSNSFRLLSVAFISERKRIDLIAEAIAHLAKIETNIEFEWIHIGDGDEQIKQKINDNRRVTFKF